MAYFERCVAISGGVICSPKAGPVTMRVQQPTTTGIRRRTLYGQTTLPGADRAQAPPGGGKASRWSYGPAGCQGTRYKRSYLPSVEKPLWRDEHRRSQAPQGAGERECSPQEASCREGTGHRHLKGGEPGKLLSPTRRKAAVEHLRRRLGVSERRACSVIGQPRSSQRYVGRKAQRDCRLAERMVRLSQENPRYGYRRVWALLRREGWPLNKKRVHKGCGARKVSKYPRSNTKGSASRSSWARARTEARGGGPSTKTKSLKLRLRYGPNRGRQKAEDDASGG